MVGSHHYRILGVSETADLDELKAAYHRAAKQSHPDLVPPHDKHNAQLRMMRINEAYMEIMAEHMRYATQDRRGDSPKTNRGEAARPTEEWPRWSQPRADTGDPSRAVGNVRDPGYTYYKLGFTYYRRGYTELYSKDPRIIRKQLAELKTYDHYLLTLTISALRYFEQSYRYFAAVIEYAPGSVWVTDARAKLRKLEKFNRIYQRICDNLSRNLRMKRAEAASPTAVETAGGKRGPE
jgi:hypothetical protein